MITDFVELMQTETANLKAFDEKTEAVKFDQQKTQGYHLIPVRALEEMAKLYQYGAAKYAPHNWRSGDGLAYTRCYDAILRHLNAWRDGEDIDAEQKLHHLASVAFYCFAVIWFHYCSERKNDDR